MEAGQTYRFAEQTLRAISGRPMSPADWQRYENAALGLRLAVDTGNLDEVGAVAGALATLGAPGPTAGADPAVSEQPSHLRTLTGKLLQDLAALAANHPTA